MKLTCDRCGTICNEPACPRCAGTLVEKASASESDREFMETLARELSVYGFEYIDDALYEQLPLLEAHIAHRVAEAVEWERAEAKRKDEVIALCKDWIDDAANYGITPGSKLDADAMLILAAIAKLEDGE